MEGTTLPLDSVFDAAMVGSERASPSALPSTLNPTQLRTCRLRMRNMGASALFRSVSPVFPSRPAWGTPRSRASASRPASEAPTDGVKRSEEHTSELQSQSNLVCRLLLQKT